MPDEEECYLVALMDDPSGIDLCEFCWVDEEQDDGCYRVWDVQWPWYSNDDVHQIDQCGRSVGKSNGIAMRGFAFPFCYPGAEMLITAPELNHLRPVTDLLEAKLMMIRLGREMLPNQRGNGLNRQPHWQARFANGARIISRLPNKDGKGVKGMHPLKLESDEMQDYPLAGWIELIETLKRGSKGAQWRAHGVARGGRDEFYEKSQPDSGWTVHRLMGMHRPTWSKEEREEKIRQYGGSRQNVDYRRNVYGDHGDASNPVFVLARLMACVDQDEGTEYNSEVFHEVKLEHERVERRGPGSILTFFDNIPGTHKAGHQLAPKGYNAYYGGMDVGGTNHPSEILIFGARAGLKTEHLDLLLRIHMRRIPITSTEAADERGTDTQEEIIRFLFSFYGAKLKSFGIDRTGLGFSLVQNFDRDRFLSSRIFGYNYSEKVIVGFEDREPERGETMEDLAIMRNPVDHATDYLRNELVDPKKVTLPFNREILNEWQGQSYTVEKSAGNPYGKRNYSVGSFHSLDAGKMMAAAKTLPLLEEMAKAKPKHAPVMDVFVGAM